MKCQTQGCDREAKVRGWCKPHYVKAWKQENVSIERREGNELYAMWTMKRKDRVREWDDFEVFKRDVGVSPGPDYRLTRIDKKVIWAPENVEWRRIEVPVESGESSKDYSARASWNTKLKQKYGIDAAQYDLMLAKQNGVCAICKNVERSSMFGNRVKLAVDHCHKTGKVRGLLCSGCNTGIGHFNEDPERIRRAIDYVESHRRVE